MTAASLWILCATLTANDYLFLVFKGKSHTSDSLKLGMFVGYQSSSKGFPGSSAGKESTRKAGDPQSIPGSGRCPGEGIGYPLQFSWASLMAQLVKNSPLGHIYHIETSYIEIKSHFSFTHLSLCTSKGHDSFLHIYPAHFSPSVSSGYLCVIFLCECNIFPLNMAISVWYLAYRKTDDFYIIL